MNNREQVTWVVDFLDIDKTQLSIKQQQVMEVVKKMGIKVAYMSIEEISKEANVSTATISRFWKIAGYKSFKQFKEHVKKRLETTPENKLRNLFFDIGSDNLLDRIIEQNYEHLFKTHQGLSREDLNKAVAAIVKAKRVIIHAPSSSEGLGSLLTYRLKRFGIPVEQLAKSGHEIYESMIHFQTGDVMVIFQYVKLLPETKVILDYTNQLGMKTIFFYRSINGKYE